MISTLIKDYQGSPLIEWCQNQSSFHLLRSQEGKKALEPARNKWYHLIG